MKQLLLRYGPLLTKFLQCKVYLYSEGERRGERIALRSPLHWRCDTNNLKWAGGTDHGDCFSLFYLEVDKKLQQRRVIPPPRVRSLRAELV